MRLASLFAGIGGFDLAAERAGMEVVWQSEIDPHASRVLDHHWPHVKNLGDVHGITDPPRVDVLTGGFPCQDYSVAGNRGGLAGDRGALWWEYHRLIGSLRPTWVVGENVPGLLSSRDGADFETIIGSLTELGYGVAWAVLDAQYFGVAQRRRRVFIVGHVGGVPRPEVLALGEGLFGHPQPRRETGEATATVTSKFAKGSGGPSGDEAQNLIAFDESDRRSGVTVHNGAFPTLPARMGLGGNNMPMVAVDVASTLHKTPGSTSDTDDSLVIAFAQNTRDEVRNLGDVAGALAAQPGMKQTTYLASPSVRRLTPLECERLQGFPDGWTNIPGNSDTQRYRQLGNAVAVPVVQWLLARLESE